VNTELKKSANMERLCKSAWREILDFAVTKGDQIIIEELAERVFGNPSMELDEEGRPLINCIEDFTYAFIGPFVIGFMRWFLLHVKRENYDKILFSARDGYLIQKLYHMLLKTYDLHDMPSDIYFSISRTLCVAAAVFSREDMIRAGKVRYALGPEAMLMRRFGLKKEDVLPYEAQKYPNIAAYILAHEKKIYVRSKEIREYYLRYMEKEGLKKGENYALFDFVSSGTCQLLLNRISGLSIRGVYAGRYYPFIGITNYTSEEEKYKLPIQAYVVNKSITEKETYFFKNYNFLEIIFTSCEPSVASMDKQGPVLDQEQRTEQELKNVTRAQEVIMEYVERISGRLKLEDEISFPFIDKILSLKDSEYTREECAFFDHCELIEDFGQGRIRIARS